LAAAGGKGAEADVEAGDKGTATTTSSSGAAPNPLQNPVVMAIAAAALLFFLLFVYSWWSSSSWKAVALTLQERNSALHDQLANIKEELATLSRTRSTRGAAALPSWQASLSEALQILQSLSQDMSSAPSQPGGASSSSPSSSTKNHRSVDSSKPKDANHLQDTPPAKRRPAPTSVPPAPTKATATATAAAHEGAEISSDSHIEQQQQQQQQPPASPSPASNSASTSTNDSNGTGKRRPAKEKSKVLGNVVDELEREVARLQQEMNQN